MVDAPSIVKRGEIVGYFTTILADSADAGDQPDMEVLNGLITLEAVDVQRLQWGTANPKMMSFTRPVILRVVSGVVMGQNTPRAFVLATHQPNANPNRFQWRATFQFDGISPQPPSVIFDVPADGVVDISQQISTVPVPAVQHVLANPAGFVKTVNGVGPDANGNVVVVGGGGSGGAGASAYEIAVANGFVGTQAQWLASLEGADGEDGLDGANGAPGAPGASAYQLAVSAGYIGTLSEWLASLKGAPGAAGADGAVGLSAYQSAVAGGYVGTVSQWIASLKGAKGDAGASGAPGASRVKQAVGGAWPARPSADASVTIIWISQPGNTSPPAGPVTSGTAGYYEDDIIVFKAAT